jgi:hypothetical protein
VNPGQDWVHFLCALYLIRFDSNRTLCGREQGTQAVERLPLHRWQDVGVGIEGQRDLAMPQQLLDDLGMNPEREQEAGRAVPQAVEPDLGTPALTSSGRNDRLIILVTSIG